MKLRLTWAWMIVVSTLLLAGGCMAAEIGVPDTPVELVVDGVRLAGSLKIPAGNKPLPVVLLIAGSGPTDRDGNNAISGINNSLKMLAEALAQSGIASLRYDKRGLGGSAYAGLREADIRFENFSDDAAAWVRFLKRDPRFVTVIVAGHSEGAMLGMLAARQADADAYISISGVGRRVSDVLREQLRPKLDEYWTQKNEAILTALENGHTVDDVPPGLQALYRPSVQPFWISMLRILPAEEIKKLAIPVLIVQGTTDIQVSVQDAQLLKQARPDAELTLIEGMNHVLKTVTLDMDKQQAAYQDPLLPLSAALPQSMTAFVLKIEPHASRQAVLP